jgi:hypothetical protein
MTIDISEAYTRQNIAAFRTNIEFVCCACKTPHKLNMRAKRKPTKLLYRRIGNGPWFEYL